MHVRWARLASWATAIQLLCGGIASRYGDSNYVGSKVSLQTDSKKAFLAADGSKIHAKQNLVTFSDGSQMVTWTNNVACKPGQRRCLKSGLTCPDLRIPNCFCCLGCRTRCKGIYIAVTGLACLACIV